MLYSMFLALFRRCKVPKRAVFATIVAGSFEEGCHVSALQDVRFVGAYFASKILFLDFMKVNPPAKHASSFLWTMFRHTKKKGGRNLFCRLLLNTHTKIYKTSS